MRVGRIRACEVRADALSLHAHRAIFDGFAGAKIALTSRAQISAYT